MRSLRIKSSSIKNSGHAFCDAPMPFRDQNRTGDIWPAFYFLDVLSQQERFPRRADRRNMIAASQHTTHGDVATESTLRIHLTKVDKVYGTLSHLHGR
jgi:hypothetical protein